MVTQLHVTYGGYSLGKTSESIGVKIPSDAIEVSDAYAVFAGRQIDLLLGSGNPDQKTLDGMESDEPVKLTMFSNSLSCRAKEYSARLSIPLDEDGDDRLRALSHRKGYVVIEGHQAIPKRQKPHADVEFGKNNPHHGGTPGLELVAERMASEKWRKVSLLESKCATGPQADALAKIDIETHGDLQKLIQDQPEHFIHRLCKAPGIGAGKANTIVEKHNDWVTSVSLDGDDRLKKCLASECDHTYDQSLDTCPRCGKDTFELVDVGMQFVDTDTHKTEVASVTIVLLKEQRTGLWYGEAEQDDQSDGGYGQNNWTINEDDNGHASRKDAARDIMDTVTESLSEDDADKLREWFGRHFGD